MCLALSSGGACAFIPHAPGAECKKRHVIIGLGSECVDVVLLG
jgi:hypothetical protein